MYTSQSYRIQWVASWKVTSHGITPSGIPPAPGRMVSENPDEVSLISFHMPLIIGAKVCGAMGPARELYWLFDGMTENTPEIHPR